MCELTTTEITAARGLLGVGLISGAVGIVVGAAPGTMGDVVHGRATTRNRRSRLSTT
ncbi:hypothetical protein [Burkholderia dolosa]|uniref:hypothetical protein n=1 Tax=Burkholderia dolosa TaxID=152500 RepID=UPI001C96A8F5|nr:hypothetical protein [Burkholderia dolosa]